MRDLKGVSLRRAVAHKLDGFFADWLKHLGAGTAKIWSQVESSMTRPAESEPRTDAPDHPSERAPPPSMRVPMQQQPLQQQQQKKEEK